MIHLCIHYLHIILEWQNISFLHLGLDLSHPLRPDVLEPHIKHFKIIEVNI